MSELKQLKEEMEKCVRCGTCRSVCPTFRVIGREAASARGKLSLIRSYLKGELEPGEDYLRHIKECTLCGACRTSCPNGVNTTGIICAARADYVEKKGMPAAASVVFKTLRESSSPLVLRLATKMQGLFFKDAPIDSGLLSRFSLPLIGNGRLMPPLAKTFFLDFPEVKSLSVQKGSSGGRPRIAFYAGCGVNYLMPNIGTASLDVLKRADAEVIVPTGQVCCGMPAYSMGDVEMARSMALKNLEAFEAGEFDFITTSCATCGYGLKTLFRKLLSGTPELAKRVEAFASKVRDITELLANDLDFIRKGKKKENGPTSVTYHDPCHLGRNQGVREAPRELISAANGVRLKEMKHPCSCCGLGGGLGISNYGLSIEITRRKAESIRDTGAQAVVTACPGCMVQLRDGLFRYGVGTKVAHVVELL